ncbi:MAG: hypothetical protein QM813_19550 [Verrucomicrobiota bacterium]
MTLSFPQLATRTLLAASLALIAPLATQGQILNPSFESGTASWIETGGFGNFTAPTLVAGLYQTVNPVQGTRLGLISNDGVATETISQTFTLSAGPNYLTFSYRYLTDEYNDPFANDAAWATLTPTVGSPLTLFSVSRNDLQAGGARAIAARRGLFRHPDHRARWMADGDGEPLGVCRTNRDAGLQC